MLTEIDISALLVDEDLADQVWDAWDKGEIDDQIAHLTWCLIVASILMARPERFELPTYSIEGTCHPFTTAL